MTTKEKEKMHAIKKARQDAIKQYEEGGYQVYDLLIIYHEALSKNGLKIVKGGK